MSYRTACMEPLDVPVTPTAADDLARRFAQGDALAFDQLVAQYGPSLSRLATRLLGWKMHEAHDALQEVFMNVYSRRHTFRQDSSLHTWLTRITLNTCRTFHRRRALNLRVLVQFLRLRSPPPEVIAVQEDELARQVRTAVGRLAAREREVVVLFYLEEMPVAEVGAILGISESAVNVRLHRARKHLTPMLTSDGELRHE